MGFQVTNSLRKLLSLKKRIRAVCGGTSASKTVSIIMWIIDWCQTNKQKKFDIMSESYPHMKDGVIKDFKAIMIDRGYWQDDKWNSTDKTYSFESGTILKFISIDKLGKAHGPRRDGLYINEANNIPFQIYDQLEVRTKEIIWLDWNPSSEFWYYTEIKDKIDHDFITLTYLDCIEALDQRTIDSIESRKGNKNWWRVYGEGQLGEVEGRIFTGWQEIEEVPFEAKLVSRGLDFGFSIDPSVLVDIYRYNGGYIVDEVLHRKGMSNRQIAQTILSTEDSTTVYADSAEPKSIEEISSYGVSIMAANKDVKQGIAFVQDQKISITKRSLRLIKDYKNYMWKTDRITGEVKNEPDHFHSDGMDAIRYGMTPFRAIDDYFKPIQVNKPKRQYRDILRNRI